MALAFPERSRILATMNRLTKEPRAQILHLLCEGNQHPRRDAADRRQQDDRHQAGGRCGQAAAWYQDRVFQNLASAGSA